MNKLSFKEQVFVGITLFSMFFGAGNLIFPPILGAQAGTSAIPAFIGFAISAIGFPILGVAAVAKAGGLKELTQRAGKGLSFVFILLIYLSIGPCLAIPRNASTSFAMAVTPFAGEAGTAVFQFAYSVVFFAVAVWLALNPTKLVENIGKKLAPVLLILIAALFVGSLVSGMTGTGEVAEHYQKAPAVVGFIDGYQTMDAIAALAYGMIIAMNIKAKGVTDPDAIAKTTIKSGYIACGIFAVVYGALTFIGTKGDVNAANGAEILSTMGNTLFGKAGMIVLAAIFIIACLNTCISLLCSCSEYFHEIIPALSYRQWVFALAIFSCVISNAGLNAILKFSIPALVTIYPVAMVMIVLALLPRHLGEKTNLFVAGSWVAFVGGFIYALQAILGENMPFMNVLEQVPLHSVGLGWLLPAAVACAIGVFIPKKKAVN